MSKDNIYHVKLKLIPKHKIYKSTFTQGIVFAKKPSDAETIAVSKITKALKKAPTEIEIKVTSTKKLRKDFLYSE